MLLWALTLRFVFLSPLALPTGKAAAFFSAAPRERRAPDRLGSASASRRTLPLARQQRGARGASCSPALAGIASWG